MEHSNFVRLLQPIEIFNLIADTKHESKTSKTTMKICVGEVNSFKTWQSIIGVSFGMIMSSESESKSNFIFTIEFSSHGDLYIIKNGVIMSNGDLIIGTTTTSIITVQLIEISEKQLKFV
jgi:hypothetical protein